MAGVTEFMKKQPKWLIAAIGMVLVGVIGGIMVFLVIVAFLISLLRTALERDNEPAP